MIVLFVIHVALFIDWHNLSFVHNIRKFACLYRFIKKICQFLGVDLRILLKNFGSNIRRNIRLFIGKSLMAFFAFFSLIILVENAEFSAPC